MKFLNYLNENISFEEAIKFFGFSNQDQITKKDIKKRYHELSLIYHPDKGGDVKKMQKLNAAYVQLKDYELEKVDTEQKWSSMQMWRIAKNVIDSSVDINKYKSYFKQFIEEDIYNAKTQNTPGQYGISYTVTYEFFNQGRTTVFYLVISVNLTSIDNIPTFGGSKNVTFDFHTENYLYHNNRKQKMQKRNFTFKNNTSFLDSPEKMFPKATLKKVFKGEKQRKFSKRDFETGLKRQMNAIDTGDYFKIPINDYFIVMDRSTFMRQGSWSFHGIYSMKPFKRLELIKYHSIMENEENFNLVIDTLKKCQNINDPKKMKILIEKTFN